jgi:hypothetical protein
MAAEAGSAVIAVPASAVRRNRLLFMVMQQSSSVDWWRNVKLKPSPDLRYCSARKKRTLNPGTERLMSWFYPPSAALFRQLFLSLFGQPRPTSDAIRDKTVTRTALDRIHAIPAAGAVGV